MILSNNSSSVQGNEQQTSPKVLHKCNTFPSFVCRHSTKSGKNTTKSEEKQGKTGDSVAFDEENKPNVTEDSNGLAKLSSQPPRAHFCAHITEPDNRFSALWPNRDDFIYAAHPRPGRKPKWQTESRYPLSDRKLEQGSNLYGVRHKKKAAYALLDIDKRSPYHPSQDSLAVERICAALEPLGLLCHLGLTSSDSGGLHLYWPLNTSVSSLQLGIAITALLESAGLKVADGILEVFPNRKPYVANGVPTLFKAHRLPLQQGSYLLDSDLQPCSSSHTLFVQRWYAAKRKNDISAKKLKRTIRQKVQHTYTKVSGKASKFLNDLNSEIEPGWTAKGQTNRLLGRIVMRTRIFGHILGAAAPLAGRALADEAERIARGLPGFNTFCGHRHDLRKRICEWVRCIANSHYFPYSSGKPLTVKQGPTWNEEQQEKARERIHSALIDLCRRSELPDGTTARATALSSYGFSQSTLYKHKDLWHPDHLSSNIRELIVAERKVAELTVKEAERLTSAEGAASLSSATSLLEGVGCNEPHSRASSDLDSTKTGLERRPGCNEPHSRASSDSDKQNDVGQVVRSPVPKQLSLNIQWALQIVREKQQANSAANRAQYKAQKLKQAAAEHLAKLKAWAASGDPVLEAEAKMQLERLANPTGAG